MNSHPASEWIDENWNWLVTEFRNQWIGATAKVETGAGMTFDITLKIFQEREIPLSDVVFVFLTDEAIQ